MSGSNSSAPVSRAPVTAAAPAELSPLGLTVHSMPAPRLEPDARRTARGRWKMLAVLAVCAAPVLASYFTYFVVRPQARTNYAELIVPTREIPSSLPLRSLSGQPVSAAGLRGQWLMIVVAGGACDARCERHLLLQRQLRETLGREKERVDKVWLVTDDVAPPRRVLEAIAADGAAASTTVLRVAAPALAQWLGAEPGRTLDEHLYLVDPMGQWMMRTPPEPDPARFKRDVERLLRASASWDTPGR